MSIRTVRDCDGCGEQGIMPISVRLVVGRLIDPAGGPSMDDDEDFDLCEKCAAWAFRRLQFRIKLSHEDSKWLTDQIRARRKAANP